MKSLLGLLMLGFTLWFSYGFWFGPEGGCYGVVDCIGYSLPGLVVAGISGYLGYWLLKS
jgi:hypothetical protein